jgi:peptide/nickel transport system substrate-binding protein
MGVFLLASTLAACEPRPPDQLRFALATSPLTLDPRHATDAASTRFVRLLYRSLVDFDEESRPVPSLARWEIVSPTHYRFTLGLDGRCFHDGAPLTAHDVKATYDAVLDPAGGSPHRTMLGMIERVETAADDTVEFYLKAPDPLFPGRLTIGVMPARALATGHPFGQQPLGSGPFALAEWEGDRLRLRRVADGLTFTFVRVPDPTMRALKLIKGEVDMLQGDLPPELVAWLGGRPELRVDQGRGTTFSYLAFNLADPVAGQLAVRQAVGHAVDRPAIARELLRGTVRLASGLLPPDHWAGHPHLDGPRYDPTRSRTLLGDLGYGPSRPLSLDLKTSSDPLRVRIATVLQHQLGEVGVDLAVRSYDWAAFYADVKGGRFQVATLSWVALRTPDIFRHAFHSGSLPPAGANRGRYVDPVVDDLIDRAERTADESEQAALFRGLQERLLETLPYLPLWFEDTVFVARRDVTGYRISADGGYDGLSDVVRVPRVLR